VTPDPTETLSRIVVVGTSCAGKSTFAQQLASTSGCPRIELDALHWGANWQPKPSEEFRRLVVEAASARAWVADGNYGVVRELLWPRGPQLTPVVGASSRRCGQLVSSSIVLHFPAVCFTFGSAVFC